MTSIKCTVPRFQSRDDLTVRSGIGDRIVIETVPHADHRNPINRIIMSRSEAEEVVMALNFLLDQDAQRSL